MPIPFPAVQITSFGCVSPLGIGLSSTRNALREATDGISRVRLFPVEGCQSQTAGQIGPDLAETAAAICPKAKRWTRASQMILLAAAEALGNAPGFAPECVVVGTTSGGMTLGEEFYRAAVRNHRVGPAARRVLHYPPQQPVHQALRSLGFDLPVRVISNACASGSNAIGLACQMIRSGAAKRVLAGGYDALTELVFAGFDCLRASTAEKCRPFDAERTGLALGEGAAMFCLQEGTSGICVTGYGSAADNHHLTQPHPSGSGPLRAMRTALDCAGLEPGAIDYINAHGTGTPLNDASEARAILELCPQAPISSTKGMTGHALGAAGAIEAAFCALAMEDDFFPANINFRAAEAEFPLRIVANQTRPGKLRRVLSNSFGFGGANATLLLERK